MLCTDKMQIDGSDIHLSQLLTKFICDSGQDTNLKLLRRTNEIKPIHVQTHKLTTKNILIMNIGYIVIMKSKISLTHKLNEIKMISTFLYILSLYSMPGKVDTCIIKFWQFYTLGEFLYQLKIVWNLIQRIETSPCWYLQDALYLQRAYRNNISWFSHSTFKICN